MYLPVFFFSDETEKKVEKQLVVRHHIDKRFLNIFLFEQDIKYDIRVASGVDMMNCGWTEKNEASLGTHHGSPH